jgi:hypothetical protein
LPAAVAARAELSGVKEATTDTLTVLVSRDPRRRIISFGAIFATTVGAGQHFRRSGPMARLNFSTALPYGVTKFARGGWPFRSVSSRAGGRSRAVHRQHHDRDGCVANRKVSTRNLLLNWLIVFAATSSARS